MSLLLQYSDNEGPSIKKWYYYADKFTTAEGVCKRAKMIERNLIKRSEIVQVHSQALWITCRYQHLFYDQITVRAKFFQLKQDLPNIQYVSVIDSNQVGGITIGSKGTPFSHLLLAGWERMRVTLVY